jgi:hypothetical protein
MNPLQGPISLNNNRGLYVMDRLVTPATTQATANVITTLDAGSSRTWVFTGTTAGQRFKLPDATTLQGNTVYELWNFSTQTIEVQDSTGAVLATIRANAQTFIFLRDNSTAAGVWALTYTLDSGNIFGTQLYYAEDNSETSTSSKTTFLNKITLTPSDPLTFGNYLVQFQFLWRAANSDRKIDVRIQRDSTDIETFNSFTASNTETTLVSGFTRQASLSGNYSFKLDFKVNGTGTTVYMQKARMFVWRIS